MPKAVSKTLSEPAGAALPAEFPGLYVVGVDPAQSESGVALFQNGRCFHSFVCSPWNLHDMNRKMADMADLMDNEDTRVRVYVEVPQNGTHASRGGVHFAAGMLVSTLGSYLYYTLRRKDKTSVTPSVWRRHVFGRTDAGKKDACRRASRMTKRKIVNHNEAEAILVASYGWHEETR